MNPSYTVYSDMLSMIPLSLQLLSLLRLLRLSRLVRYAGQWEEVIVSPLHFTLP